MGKCSCRRWDCVIVAQHTRFDCLGTVPRAIDALNAAAGRPVLRFEGMISRDFADEAWKRGQVIVVAEELPDEFKAKGILAFTPSEIDDNVCITRSSIQVQSFWLTYRDHGAAVILHELIHALGGQHFEGSHNGGFGGSHAGYKSIMAPSMNSAFSADHLTPSDVASLRAAYGSRS